MSHYLMHSPSFLFFSVPLLCCPAAPALQLLGFSDLAASSLIVVFGAGCAMGGLLGGSLGDAMARRLPNNGRILTCQLSGGGLGD